MTVHRGPRPPASAGFEGLGSVGLPASPSRAGGVGGGAGSGPGDSGKSGKEKKGVARLHHPLSVRVPAPRCPHLTLLAALVAQLYVSHGTRGGAHSRPEEPLPGRGAVLPGACSWGLQPLRAQGCHRDDATENLLEAGGRGRPRRSVAEGEGTHSGAAPARYAPGRARCHFPGGEDLSPGRGDAPAYSGASLFRPLPRPSDPSSWLHPSNFLMPALRTVDFAARPPPALQILPCRPSEPLMLGLRTSPGQILEMPVVQPVTFEGDLTYRLHIPSQWLCPFRGLLTPNYAI